jgi:hypothetical protein
MTDEEYVRANWVRANYFPMSKCVAICDGSQTTGPMTCFDGPDTQKRGANDVFRKWQRIHGLGNFRVADRHSRLPHCLQWRASKLAPKKYGDKVQQEVSGPDGGPVQALDYGELR